MLDKVRSWVYIVQARLREPKLSDPELKKLEKKKKFFLTKEKSCGILDKLSPRSGRHKMYLEN